jgi:Tol biopolymer transport system component
MFAPGSQHLNLTFRALLPRLLLLAVPWVLGACDGADDPVAPAAEPLAGEQESAVPEYTLAAGTTQRIVFTSTRKGGYDVFKMDPQGSNLVPLATSTDFEFSPAWSRDNKRIALVRQRFNGSYTHDDIYVMNADGTNGHWARSTPTDYDLMFPTWSPDGTRLVVCMQISGGLYLGWINLATGQLNPYSTGYGGLQGQKPSYSPISQQFVYVGVTGKTIDRINTDGSNHKTLVTSATYVGDPAFSPDGKKIVFTKLINTSFDIHVKNLVDGTVKRLTTSAAYDGQPSWSPDGSRIAFTSYRSGQYQIWTMNASGGDLLRITHTTSTEKDPAWSH